MKLLISLAIALAGTAKPPRCEIYPTVAASDAWIARVQPLPPRQQLTALRQRLTCDARVRGPQPAAAICVSCLTAEGQRAYREAQEKRRLAEAADTRPVGITLFYLLDGQPIAANDTAQWQPRITRQFVRNISFVASKQAEIMGGSRAQNGMVFITTKKQ